MSTTGGGCVTLLGAGVRNAKGAFLTEPVASFFGASVTVAVVVDDDVVSGALNWTPATLVKAINEDKAATPNDVCAKGKKYSQQRNDRASVARSVFRTKTIKVLRPNVR